MLRTARSNLHKRASSRSEAFHTDSGRGLKTHGLKVTTSNPYLPQKQPGHSSPTPSVWPIFPLVLTVLMSQPVAVAPA